MTKGKIKLKPTFKSKKAERNCRFCITFWCMFVMFLSINSLADEMVHKFKSPSFNGIGTSSHYLTIESQENIRKMSVKAEIKALQEQIARDAENTTLARIYAQLSRQLVDNLFGDTAQTSGVIELEGNRIEYTSDGIIITLKITDPDGNVTEISLPIGSFTF